MSSRTVASLHITNGDSVVYTFKKAGILGTHLPWRDVLHEGPVPGELPLEDCSRVRGAYLAARGHGKPIRVLHEFQARDAVIRRVREFDEVVLWFEHDLYDQLQILQILHVLREMNLEPGSVSIVQSDSYLGSMTAEEIVTLHPKRRTVTRAMFDRAASVWRHFCAPEPSALLEDTASEHPGFPHLRAAVRRLCEEYPWTGDGLSRSQRQALQSVAQGPARVDELFRRAQAREEAPFLGDTTFYAIVDDLRRSPAPLIEGNEGLMTPTALGRRILAGDADWLLEAPANRWIGGVHVSGANPPRWDDTRGTFKLAEEAVD
jgi:hypothetical protein